MTIPVVCPVELVDCNCTDGCERSTGFLPGSAGFGFGLMGGGPDLTEPDADADTDPDGEGDIGEDCCEFKAAMRSRRERGAAEEESSMPSS